MSSNSKRRIETDVMKLLMSNHDVELIHDNMQEFNVKFYGPKETPYENGIWRLHVELPDNYPYKSPSIGFVNKIFHPNIDIASGSICLDVINSTWSPLYDLINIVEWMIPGLLKEPNGSDPLNNEAATLQLRDKKLYEEKIKEYIDKYATEEKYNSQFSIISSSDENDDDDVNEKDTDNANDDEEENDDEENEDDDDLSEIGSDMDAISKELDDELSDLNDDNIEIDDELSDINMSDDDDDDEGV